MIVFLTMVPPTKTGPGRVHAAFVSKVVNAFKILIHPSHITGKRTSSAMQRSRRRLCSPACIHPRGSSSQNPERRALKPCAPLHDLELGKWCWWCWEYVLCCKYVE